MQYRDPPGHGEDARPFDRPDAVHRDSPPHHGCREDAVHAAPARSPRLRNRQNCGSKGRGRVHHRHLPGGRCRNVGIAGRIPGVLLAAATVTPSSPDGGIARRTRESRPGGAAPGQPIRLMLAMDGLGIGGAETVVRDLARTRSIRSGSTSSVCCLKVLGVVDEALAREGVDIFVLPAARGRRCRLPDFAQAPPAVRDRQVDVLHSHTTHALVDAGLCKLMMPRLKAVHTFHFGNYPHRGTTDPVDGRPVRQSHGPADGRRRGAAATDQGGVPPGRLAHRHGVERRQPGGRRGRSVVPNERRRRRTACWSGPSPL